MQRTHFQFKRREELKHGLEPDECCSRDRDTVFPDVALEVVVTNRFLDKLDVYRGLGVREVWVFRDAEFQRFGLRGASYEPLAASAVFPEVELARIARALRAYRSELREQRGRTPANRSALRARFFDGHASSQRPS